MNPPFLVSFVSWPLAYNVIRGRKLNNTFGLVRKDGNGRQKPHQGWDFEAAVGTTAYAIADGKIDHVELNRGAYGTRVCLEFSHGGRRLFAYYAHMSSVLVRAGDQVTAGQPIAATGKSGNARNLPPHEDHLHFEIRTRARAGLGLGHRLSPVKIYGICPLREPAYQNFSSIGQPLMFADHCGY